MTDKTGRDWVGWIGISLWAIAAVALIALTTSGCSPIFWPGGAIVLELFNG